MTDQPTATVWVVWATNRFGAWSCVGMRNSQWAADSLRRDIEADGYKVRIDALTSTLPADKEETK